MKIIGGEFRGRSLSAPPKQGVRPTSARLREAFFNICQTRIEGARFLDLFGGTGAMGLEALSRGASQVVFIERDKMARRCIEENCRRLQVSSRATVLEGEAQAVVQQLAQSSKPFDILFADPPYGRVEGNLTLADWVVQSKTIHSLTAPQGVLFLEEERAPQHDEALWELISHRKHGRANLWHFRKR